MPIERLLDGGLLVVSPGGHGPNEFYSAVLRRSGRGVELTTSGEDGEVTVWLEPTEARDLAVAIDDVLSA